jgi:2-aminoadipate transaminase
VWLTLPPDVDPAALAGAAAEAGIAYAPGESFTLGDEGRGALALAFASMPPERLRDGVALLARLAEAARRRRKTG